MRNELVDVQKFAFAPVALQQEANAGFTKMVQIKLVLDATP